MIEILPSLTSLGVENPDLLQLFPYAGDSASLVVKTRADNYCASILARAVEDCDAHLLNLNVGQRTSGDDGEWLTVYLRVDHRNGESVARSLERFGYEVVSVKNTVGGDNDELARQRANELMRYLEI